MSDIQWVQLTIPHPSAALLAAACQKAMNEWDGTEHGYNMLNDLRDFFTEAAENPRAFPPSGTMASSLKARARRGRGVRRNDGSLKDGTPRVKGRRKNRAERRARQAKERRLHRAEDAASFNAARDTIELERELGEVAGHRQLSIAERIRGLTRGRPGRAEGQDPSADVPGQ